MQRLRRLASDTRAATAIEYGLICGLIVVVMVVGLSQFASAAIRLLTNVADASSNAL